MDSIISTQADSSCTLITVSGVAKMTPGEVITLGIGRDSANQTAADDLTPNNDLDSWTITCPAAAHDAAYGITSIPFSFQTYFKKTTAGALTDTIYFNAVVAGGDTLANLEYLMSLTSLNIN